MAIQHADPIVAPPSDAPAADRPTGGFNVDIIAIAKENDLFRRVLSTGTHAQVVVMSIPVGGEIGSEVHPGLDQVLVFVEGSGVAVIDGDESAVGPGHLVHVPAHARHNVINQGTCDMRLYTVYAPPQHAPGTIHRTKAEADADKTDHYVAPTATSGSTGA